MNNAIRHTWIVSVALFVVLFGALSLIQVALTEELNQNETNARQLIADRGAPRGPITVDGSPIAESVESEGSRYEYQRVYHDPYLYSGITGFFSVHEPANGLEGALNEYLTGHSDAQFFDRVSAMFTGQTLQGAQVELTIDGELQQMAHEMIPDGRRGSIIVQDTNTGEIVVMASKPSFDTNDLAVHSHSEFQENKNAINELDGRTAYHFPPVNSTIAPGSVFKLVDTLAMLESGEYDADTELDNPNTIELPQSESTLSNMASGNCHQRSEAEFRWIFAQSCNTPFAEAAMELGQEEIREAAEAFGWNSPHRIPLYVSESVFPEDLADSELAHSAIGQYNVTATPMQMTMVSQAIANGGTLLQPNLVDTIRGSDLQMLSSPEPEVLNEVMDSSTADEMTELMVGTVEEGTGFRAQSSQFDVAAKTGTAETGDEGLVNTWITGFAPADDPQYAVTVVYERIPQTEGTELTGPQMLAMLEAVIEE